MTDFQRDLAYGRRAELIVFNTLSSLGYKVQDVADNKEYYHRGDIILTDALGNQKFVEVKNDRCIHNTQNVLCEERVWYENTGRWVPGNMNNDTDIYVVVAEEAREIYFFDFKVLQEHYKSGYYKEFNYSTQSSICRLLPIGVISKYGGYYGKVEF